MAITIKRSGVIANLSLTPLIDVVFLLLIFFLVTSQFEEEERRLNIVLPSATSASPMVHRPREIVVDVDAQGNVYLRGQPTTLTELERLLVAAVVENASNQSVIIRADASASFQPVVSVMDLCNRAGLTDYSVTTRDGPAGAP
jgi:biopolymer transport protein ExbD